MREKNRILFLIPMNNVVLANTFSCFTETILELQQRNYEIQVAFSNDTFITEARYKLAKTASDSPNEIDYVFWIDSDQVLFSATHVIELIQHLKTSGYDIIGGTYFTRDYPPGTPRPVALVKNADANDKYKFIQNLPEAGQYEVDVIGMGFCAMEHSTLQHLIKLYDRELFNIKLRQGVMVGEDVVFCEYAKKEGYRVAIDASIKIGHGFATVDKTIYNAMNQYSKKIKEGLNG